LLENLPKRPFVISKRDKLFNELFTIRPGKQHYSNHPTLEQKGNGETGHDIDKIVMQSNFLKEFTGWIKFSTFADSIQWYAIPTMTKARHMAGKTLQEPYAVIMRFRHETHFGTIPKVQDISKKNPWEKKKNGVVWRGGPSGTGFYNQYEKHLSKPSREELVRKWNQTNTDEIDVGLIPKWRYKGFDSFIKNKMSIEDMLQYKYLLSVEGNDVATNLKWAMSSNSLVLMPRPRVESWFCESLLEPWVHYIPIKDDFSDLLVQKRWCDSHPEKCQEIIQEANLYVESFLNRDRDLWIARHVFEIYVRNVEIKITD
jgi:hypothetical protein